MKMRLHLHTHAYTQEKVHMFSHSQPRYSHVKITTHKKESGASFFLGYYDEVKEIPRETVEVQSKFTVFFINMNLPLFQFIPQVSNIDRYAMLRNC